MEHTIVFEWNRSRFRCVPMVLETGESLRSRPERTKRDRTRLARHNDGEGPIELRGIIPADCGMRRSA